MKLPWISRKRLKREYEYLKRKHDTLNSVYDVQSKYVRRLEAENIALHRQAHDMITAVENSIEADKPKEE